MMFSYDVDLIYDAYFLNRALMTLFNLLDIFFVRVFGFCTSHSSLEHLSPWSIYLFTCVYVFCCCCWSVILESLTSSNWGRRRSIFSFLMSQHYQQQQQSSISNQTESKWNAIEWMNICVLLIQSDWNEI